MTAQRRREIWMQEATKARNGYGSQKFSPRHMENAMQPAQQAPLASAVLDSVCAEDQAAQFGAPVEATTLASLVRCLEPLEAMLNVETEESHWPDVTARRRPNTLDSAECVSPGEWPGTGTANDSFSLSPVTNPARRGARTPASPEVLWSVAPRQVDSCQLQPSLEPVSADSFVDGDSLSSLCPSSASKQRKASPKRWHLSDLADRWAANHSARPPVAAASVTYPSGVAVDLFELASILELPQPVTSAAHRLQLAWALETGSFAQTALQTYRAIDVTSDGCLSLESGALQEFMVAMFREHQLTPLTDAQLQRAYSFFDQGRQAPVDARECLCLADALLRVVIRCAATPLNAGEASQSVGTAADSTCHVVGTAADSTSYVVFDGSSKPMPPLATTYSSTWSSAGGSNTDPIELPADAHQWNTVQVGSWVVNTLGLPSELGDLMYREEVNGDVLLSLAESDLEGLGVAPFGRRRKLWLGLQGLRERSASVQPVPVATHVGDAAAAVKSVVCKPEVADDSTRASNVSAPASSQPNERQSFDYSFSADFSPFRSRPVAACKGAEPVSVVAFQRQTLRVGLVPIAAASSGGLTRRGGSCTLTSSSRLGPCMIQPLPPQVSSFGSAPMSSGAVTPPAPPPLARSTTPVRDTTPVRYRLDSSGGSATMVGPGPVRPAPATATSVSSAAITVPLARQPSPRVLRYVPLADASQNIAPLHSVRR